MIICNSPTLQFSKPENGMESSDEFSSPLGSFCNNESEVLWNNGSHQEDSSSGLVCSFWHELKNREQFEAEAGGGFRFWN